MKRAFKVKQKAFFVMFKGLSVIKNCSNCHVKVGYPSHLKFMDTQHHSHYSYAKR